jgi:hypothetical protein
LADEYLAPIIELVEKFPVATVESVEGSGFAPNAVDNRLIDQFDCNLRLGLKLDILWHMSFFGVLGCRPSPEAGTSEQR